MVEGLVVVEPLENVKGVCWHGAEYVENVQDCQCDEELVEEVRPELPGREDNHGGEGADETDDPEGHEEDTFEPELDSADDGECFIVALPTSGDIKVVQ